jgi:endonuclease/exonuclease/phosphatase family metal-dependent hydrolase
MIKLVSVNIEGDRHLERVRPFLAEENPDIICLQEAFRDDVQELIGSEYQTEFLPMSLKERSDGSLSVWGVSLATRSSAWRVVREYYHQPTTTLVPSDERSVETKRMSMWQGVIGVTIEAGGVDYTLFTTHFTWTPNGVSNQYQSVDMERLLSFLGEQGPHVLCGDFNIPRKQNSLYPLLHAHYTDHVPEEYETSMYIPLHLVRDNPKAAADVGSYMVDYILSTPGTYRVRDVALRGNVSDHCALIAHIEKNP